MRRLATQNLLLLIAIAGLSVGAHADGLNLAPLVYWETGADGETDLRVGGPLFQAAAAADGAELVALRPLAIRLRVPANDERERLVRREILWPLSSWRLRGNELHAWFGPMVRTNADVSDAESAYRRYLLPILFAGRDADGEDYRAVFPLAGTLRDVAGMDELSFRLFPLWLATQKGEIRGRHWLFPIVAAVDGPGVEKRRIFPLWGYSEKEDAWRRSFALWPIVHWQKSLRDPGDGGFMILPLYGKIWAGKRGDKRYLRRWTFLWPFFSKAVSNDGSLLHAPWPLVQRVSAPREELERTAVLPFWGKQSRGPMETTHVGWPLHARQRDDRGNEIVTRTYLLPIYWSFVAESANETDEALVETRRYTRVWPLYSYARDADGTQDLRVLDLWPQRNVEPIERAYAPFWTLYRSNVVDGTRRREFLWGLWRCRHEPDGSGRTALAWIFDHTKSPDGNNKTSLLGGLIKLGK